MDILKLIPDSAFNTDKGKIRVSIRTSKFSVRFSIRAKIKLPRFFMYLIISTKD